MGSRPAPPGGPWPLTAGVRYDRFIRHGRLPPDEVTPDEVTPDEVTPDENAGFTVYGWRTDDQAGETPAQIQGTDCDSARSTEEESCDDVVHG
ncbi:hypothetical protein [Frankia sp. CiP1_Cm_nod1]|uniref:hypothetical protein n=1 Tax=Frankia sp. CiP1_Cm_nod1 TaxID=2897160 RepID=UPI0020245C9E